MQVFHKEHIFFWIQCHLRDIDAIILELKQIRRKLSGKRQPLPYYGRVDTLLEQMHDTLRDFNQSH